MFFDEEVMKQVTQSFQDIEVRIISKKEFHYLKQHRQAVEYPTLYKRIMNFFFPSHTSLLVRVNELEEFKQLSLDKTPVLITEKLTEEAVAELPLRYPTIIYTLEIDNLESWSSKWKSRIIIR